jgi:hypothetical protein
VPSMQIRVKQSTRTIGSHHQPTRITQPHPIHQNEARP